MQACTANNNVYAMASTCKRGREGGRDACILKFVAELAWGLCMFNCTSWAQTAMKMIGKKKGDADLLWRW